MLIALLAMAGQSASDFTQPQEEVSAVLANDLVLGQCNALFDGTVDAQAVLRISWTLVNVDAARFDIKLYEDGVQLVPTLPGDTTLYDKTIAGSVVAGRYPVWQSNWIYRVDVVRKDDNVVVSSSTSEAWIQSYGGCFSG